MTISAQVSVYPLRQARISPAIDAVRGALEEAGLEAQVGAMSTIVSGEASRVFEALRRGFERAAADGHVVMVLTVSNACPVQERDASGVGGL